MWYRSWRRAPKLPVSRSTHSGKQGWFKTIMWSNSHNMQHQRDLISRLVAKDNQLWTSCRALPTTIDPASSRVFRTPRTTWIRIVYVLTIQNWGLNLPLVVRVAHETPILKWTRCWLSSSSSSRSKASLIVRSLRCSVLDLPMVPLQITSSRLRARHSLIRVMQRPQSHHVDQPNDVSIQVKSWNHSNRILYTYSESSAVKNFTIKGGNCASKCVVHHKRAGQACSRCWEWWVVITRRQEC